jgi:hypothetical protein
MNTEQGDIRGCFDNISHEWMLRHIPTDKVILQKWLKAGFVENRILFPTEAGTPQGGIISPVLANLTLDGLEQRLNEHFRVKILNGQRHHPKVNLVSVSERLKPASSERIKSGHFEGERLIAEAGSRWEQLRDESTQNEPATVHRYLVAARVVLPADRAGAATAPGDGFQIRPAI